MRLEQAWRFDKLLYTPFEETSGVVVPRPALTDEG